MFEYVSDVAFTPAVKRLQETKGSRKGYARMEEKAGWENALTEELAQFIGERDSFYLGTANADGQPYIQHRGGKPGFLKIINLKKNVIANYIVFSVFSLTGYKFFSDEGLIRWC